MLKEVKVWQYDPDINMAWVILSAESTVKEVLHSEEYFLNPAAPWNSQEHMVLKGTNYEYAQAYPKLVDRVIASRFTSRYGFNWRLWPENWEDNEAELQQSYRDWWRQHWAKSCLFVEKRVAG